MFGQRGMIPVMTLLDFLDKHINGIGGFFFGFATLCFLYFAFFRPRR